MLFGNPLGNLTNFIRYKEKPPVPYIEKKGTDLYLYNIGSMPLEIGSFQLNDKYINISDMGDRGIDTIDGRCPTYLRIGARHLIIEDFKEEVEQLRICYETNTLFGKDMICKDLNNGLRMGRF